MTLEDQLRDALRGRADRFEPSDGSYVRLERRLAEATTATATRPGIGPRVLAVAASLAVVAGAGIFVLTSDDGGSVVAGPDDSTPSAATATEVDAAGTDAADTDDAGTDAAQADVVDDPAGDDDAPGPDPTLGAVEPAPPGILGPPRTTWREAALDFLELIQVPSERAVLEPRGANVLVSAESEAGSLLPVTELVIGSRALAGGEAGFVVVEARSPAVSIDSPASLTVVSENRLVVEGAGTGFEGVVEVAVYSADDGVALVKTFTQAGNFGELADFERTVNVYGVESAWVVVSSSTGTEAGIPEFAASPFAIRAPLPQARHVVTNITAGDPDGGLVVRQTPAGERVGVIPAATGDIRVRGVPSQVGDQRWVNIWLPEALSAEVDREAAWVNSAYLALDDPLDEATLETIGVDFAAAVQTGGVGFDQLPWTDRRSVVVGWGVDPEQISGTSLDLTETWDDVRTWTVPEERFGVDRRDESLRSLVDLGTSTGESEFALDVGVETGDDPTKVSPYGVVQTELAPRFAGTQWVRLSDPDDDSSEWKTVTLFVENTAGGPRIVGVIVDFWVP